MYVAQAASGNNYWLVYLMFLIAGVLAGGTWSVYKNGSRGFAVVLGVLAGIARRRHLVDGGGNACLMTVENNTKKTVATTDGLAGTADPVTSTMQLFTEVPGFTALSFATAAAFGAFSLMLPVIPLAVILTTGSDTLAGATTMVFMAVTVATQLVTNRIIRRYGYRRVMLAAAFLLGVRPCGIWSAWTPRRYCWWRRCGAWGSVPSAWRSSPWWRTSPRREPWGRRRGIIGLFTGAAQMVGLPAGLWLSEHVGNSVVFIAGALVALVAAGLAVLIHNPAPEPVISRPEPPLEHGRKQLRMREKLRGGTVWVLAAPPSP